jgi:hypothetical protein
VLRTFRRGRLRGRPCFLSRLCSPYITSGGLLQPTKLTGISPT